MWNVPSSFYEKEIMRIISFVVRFVNDIFFMRYLVCNNEMIKRNALVPPSSETNS